MDKYEFNIKVEQIKKLINKGDYETAMKIADTIDWRRVRSTSLLTMVAQVYERNEEYQDAKDILLLAYERAPIGKGLLFKLTDLALREGNVQEAEAYYREFCDLTGDDPRQNLLRFLILEAKGAPVEQQINSLERYCQEELDEKWMYHLAELYKDAGKEDDCVKTCDKIMLMFGLGKYVDKAMELKLQFAPLTKYQMDLVENREKYEEKLRAVEEKYKNGTYRSEPEEEYYDSEDPEDEVRGEKPAKEDEAPAAPVLDEDLAVSLHEAKAEEDLAREVSKLTPYEEESSSPAAETRIFQNVRDLHEQRTQEQEEAETASVEEADAETEEKVADAETAEKTAAQETAAEDEETVVEDWDLEADEEEESSNHLMIEAEDPEGGLALALESLKKIHRELGSKNPVAKISGDKLSRKGIFAVADRLAGKDLVVERAGDLTAETVDELNQLMERDETGMIVVLIDTPSRMEQLHSRYPELAGKFQYIGCDTRTSEYGARAQAAAEARARETAAQEAEEARKRLAEREEEIRRQAARDAQEARRLQLIREEEARRQAELAAEEARRREEEARYQAEVAAEEARRQAELEAENAARYQAELAAEEARRQAEYEEDLCRREEEEARRQHSYESDGGYPEDAPSKEYEKQTESDPYGEKEVAQDDGKEMDVEEFVQYACKYAAEIDCSISGKSMLALYERAEMMEEDGEPLTRISAEDLIEEAADKAEKKSFGDLFSSKYDKDGLLILKEKHFFD
ncbi:MAG: hypothetical protein PUB88_05165 [Clostridium sp.]|nr:hypothetical protein [Clostridium sp.]